MDVTLYDSHNLLHKKPFGAVKTNEMVRIRVRLPLASGLHSPVLLIYEADHWEHPRRIEMHVAFPSGLGVFYECWFSSEKPMLYFYLFEVTGPNGITHICRTPEGFGRLSGDVNDKWQLTVYDEALKTPDFLKQGVMYQIFPDRFYASGTPKAHVPDGRRLRTDWGELPEFRPNQNGEVTNSDYFGGDLAGIAEKLPYIASLGVRCIYLNPIFEAHSNHRYDTADYEKIDPLLGTEADFKTLCDQARELGIHIICDGVFNHTGSDSVYFNKKRRYGEGGAYNDPHSRYYTWYEFIHYPNDYSSWWGFDTLPSVNELDPDYSDFICGENGVLRKWLKLGLSGYRLDVVDELPDAFLDKICASVKGYDPQAAVIGEVWEDATTKFAYGVRRRYFLGGQLDSVMNYPFRTAILDYVARGNWKGFYQTVMDILEHYPQPVIEVLMNSLSTHDVERAITVLGGEPAESHGREWQGAHHYLTPNQYAKGKALFKVASLIQYTLHGLPCLYYGDEAGAFGYKDPFNRTCYPWGNEDQELVAWFTALGKLRGDYPMLCSAAFLPVSITAEHAVYTRKSADVELLIAVNRTENQITVPLPEQFLSEQATLVLGGIHSNRSLDAYGYAVVEIRFV